MGRKRKSMKDSKSKLINLKMTPADHRALLKKAKEFSDGNLSAFLRRAGLLYGGRKLA